MLPDLVIDVEDRPDGVCVRVAGEVDIANSTRFKRVLDGVLDRRPERVMVDLAAVTFMDSNGLAVLLAVRTRARAEGARFGVSSISPFLERVFAITGLAEILQGG